MTERPTPKRRHADPERQIAYEQGFAQCYDHDSFRTLDWMEHAVDDEPTRCELRAAMLEGAADALLALVERQHEGAP